MVLVQAMAKAIGPMIAHNLSLLLDPERAGP